MTVLLVDDERVELDMLEHCLEWDSLGVENVYTAGNGKRALQIVQDVRPDIVITDIEMPVMDGITLAHRIRDMGLNIKIIYLTGYDDFAYIKVAFKINAVDYILKPVVPVLLKEAITRSAALIEKDKETEQSTKLSRQVLMEQLVLTGELNTASGLARDLSERFMMIQVYGGMDKDVCERLCRHFPEIRFGIWEHDKTTFLLKQSDRGKTVAADILLEGKKDNPNSMNLIYMKDPLDLQALHKGYLGCCPYKDQLYYEEDGMILEAEYTDLMNQADEEPKPTCKPAQNMYIEVIHKYQDGLQQADAEKIQEITRNLFERLKGYRCDAEAVVHLLCAIVYELDACFVRERDEVHPFMYLTAEAVIGKIRESRHSLEAQTLLTKYLMQIFSYFESKRQGKNSYVVMKVKAYIKRNYQSQISMEALGAALYLSPNYIRGIFKEETGKTILEYVTNYRFTTACRLLKNKKLKIREVSSQVGYENVSYFCSVFAKRYGASPSEYRNTL